MAGSQDRAQRLDLFIQCYLPEHSRSRIQQLIKEGHVSVNHGEVKAGYKIRPGDRVSVSIPEPEPLDLRPWEYPLQILYEDSALLVIDKPAGMVVHPSAGHGRHTLVHALLAYLEDIPHVGGAERPGIVHRLDKDTSGVLVVAKSDRAHRELSRQFKEGTVKKSYVAIVKGHMPQTKGVIEAPIGRHPINRKKMSVHSRAGKYALTFWQVKQEFAVGATLLNVELKTGRTHQIRVHLAMIGHPVIGDATYGGKNASPLFLKDERCRKAVKRHMLHAADIGFIHPESGQWLACHALLPQDMSEVLAILTKKNDKKQ